MPGIMKDPETGDYLLWGPLTPEVLDQIAHRIGPDEAAVEVPAELVERFLWQQLSWWERLRMRLRNLWAGMRLRKKFRKLKKDA